jgi:VanZ family protein
VLFWPTDGAEQPFPAADKVVHLVLFLLLAATARWRFGGALPALALVAVYAVVSEVVQGVALDERSGDALDVVADLVGAGLGWAVTGRFRGTAGTV